MNKSAGWNVSRLVDLTAPGPRSLSPRGGSRFVAVDGSELSVNDLLFFGPDTDYHQSFDAELQLGGPKSGRRAKVQLDVSRFNGQIGEIVLRTRDASRLRGIDSEAWHAVARLVLDAIYTPPAAAPLVVAPAAEAGNGLEAEEERAA